MGGERTDARVMGRVGRVGRGKRKIMQDKGGYKYKISQRTNRKREYNIKKRNSYSERWRPC